MTKDLLEAKRHDWTMISNAKTRFYLMLILITLLAEFGFTLAMYVAIVWTVLMFIALFINVIQHQEKYG